MPPKLRARSTSRSRNAVSAPSSEKKTKMSKSPSPAKSARKASKSPARARTSNVKKTPSRSASKSATRGRTASKTPKTPSKTPSSASARSRSRSRGRPTNASRLSASTPSASSTSVKRSRSVTKTPRDVVKTIEVADDEDEVTTPSRLRQRNVRNLTQDPPASRSRLPRAVHHTFEGLPVRTTRSASKAQKSQCCAFLTNAKAHAISAYNWIAALLSTIFAYIHYIITAPFVFLRNQWRLNRPENNWLAAAMIIVLCTSFCVIFFLAFPKFVDRCYVYGQKHIAVPAQRFQRQTYSKISQWSGDLHDWSYAKWQALSNNWVHVGTQTK
ncbi:uncharacterized protein CELE_T09B4.5 [Caenorhabditis elegans]|uniref:Uncharacterized protein n=1 Tax=Caenorhabditis elegans TaxID=6239 RepID=O02155_CAEEL|nr:Uncharacterized protein CELE_T09B4.5 [Caenorhabditis elegans]CCD71990.1 Uncharacterized protein CELE_T09B4.5 [Caenorhabditis elegans]|eukprot:NP_491774.1 Uncharacterized protein CELE_T09B4.5 [Caenorhabditis elegans]